MKFSVVVCMNDTTERRIRHVRPEDQVSSGQAHYKSETCDGKHEKVCVRFKV